jgi:CHAD domain-containing protein
MGVHCLAMDFPMGKHVIRLPPDASAAQSAPMLLHSFLTSMHSRAKAVMNGGDVEDVHQLRVVSRRLSTGLRTLADFLLEKDVQRFLGRLRKLRRAAGDARNLDVYLQDLESLHRRGEKARTDLLESLVDRARRDRKQAQRRLEKAVRRLDKKEFWSWADELLRPAKAFAPELDATHSETMLERAQRQLPLLLDDFLHAAPTADSSDDDFHRLRIAGKRLRYAMELFAGCFEEGMTRLLETLKGAQELLGRLNDWRTQGELLEELLDDEKLSPRTRRSAERLLRLYRRRRTRGRKECLEFWRARLGERFQKDFLKLLDVPHPAPSSNSPLSQNRS